MSDSFTDAEEVSGGSGGANNNDASTTHEGTGNDCLVPATEIAYEITPQANPEAIVDWINGLG